ncbi:hypothetical protein NDU88_002823 [Pleurodeles waltl]|uniref:Uncharacterized protein n=1 Tax=Pleurodeles waltl TaxID=8319 RepID=A0AAV7M2S5_PLEWA|nr:hypothetical protein NDU88_002823 [Pleurodeles waltl]
MFSGAARLLCTCRHRFSSFYYNLFPQAAGKRWEQHPDPGVGTGSPPPAFLCWGGALYRRAGGRIAAPAVVQKKRGKRGRGGEGERPQSVLALPGESPPPCSPPHLALVHPRRGSRQRPAPIAPLLPRGSPDAAASGPHSALVRALPLRPLLLRRSSAAQRHHRASCALAGRARGRAQRRLRPRGRRDHLMPRPPAHTRPSSGPCCCVPSRRAAWLFRSTPAPRDKLLCLWAGRQATPSGDCASTVTGIT